MAKYLANELSEADSADFEHKLAADSNFNEEFEMSLLAWHESNESEDISFDSDKAWNIVSSKIGKTNTLESKPRPTYTFLKIAATLIIVLSAGYFLSDYNGIIDSPTEPVVLVAHNDFKEFQLSDGSTIKLKANSSISYEEGFGSTHRQLILEGGANFDVNRNENLPFIIKTDKSVLKVLGTSFDLSAYPNKDVELNVREGLVNFTNKSQENVSNEIQAGEKAVLSYSSNDIQTSELTSNNYAAWWTGKLVFEETPMTQVAKDLENTYGVSIELKGGLGNCPLNATYTKDTLNEILELIQATFVESDIQVTYSKENALILEGKACTN